jgi:peroxiredoxin
MMLFRFSSIFIVCIALYGCVPSPEESTPLPRLYDTVEYKANVSRLFGDGGKTVIDNFGTRASDIVWKDASGTLHSLQELQGEVIVLNMWATWCVPCRRELPVFQDIADEYASSGVRMIGIAIDHVQEPFRLVSEFATDYDITFQLIVDSAATSYINYGGTGDIPRTYVIDRNGYIQHIFVGEAKKEQLVEVIEALL